MLGCFTIHFLVVSIGHQGTAFALFWILLAKKGNANTKERIQLIDPFLDVLERVMHFAWLLVHWRYGTKTLPQ